MRSIALLCLACGIAAAAPPRPLLFHNVASSTATTVRTTATSSSTRASFAPSRPRCRRRGRDRHRRRAARRSCPASSTPHARLRGQGAEQALVFGVTTELEMFGDPPRTARCARESGPAKRPARPICARRASLATAPERPRHRVRRSRSRRSRKPEEAQAFVDARVAEGSDYLKIVLDDGKSFGKEHSRRSTPRPSRRWFAPRTRVTCSRSCTSASQAGARTALDAGADGLAHLFIDSAPAADFASFVAAHHAFVIPTLSVLDADLRGQRRPATRRRRRRSRRTSTRATSRSSDDVPGQAAGGAAGGVRARGRQAARRRRRAAPRRHRRAQPGVVHGASLHRELELLVDAGLTPAKALTAATATPAARFGLDRSRTHRAGAARRPRARRRRSDDRHPPDAHHRRRVEARRRRRSRRLPRGDRRSSARRRRAGARRAAAARLGATARSPTSRTAR